MRGWAVWTIRNKKPTWRRSNVGTIGTSWWRQLSLKVYNQTISLDKTRSTLHTPHSPPDRINTISDTWRQRSLTIDLAVEVGELWIIWSSLISLSLSGLQEDGDSWARRVRRSGSGKYYLEIIRRMLNIKWSCNFVRRRLIHFIIIISHNCISPSCSIIIRVPSDTWGLCFSGKKEVRRSQINSKLVCSD